MPCIRLTRSAAMLLPLTLIAAMLGPADGRGASTADASDDRDRLAARRTPVVDVFERNRDAVVNIASTRIVEVRSPMGFDRLFDDFFDMPSPFQQRRRYARQSVGSGFVLHEDGYIITNAHVVARTAERRAIFADEQEYDAEIIALDTQRDLALLKIDTPHALQTVTLGRSHDLMPGESVVAIGNPLGYQHTVTAGVVSATDRELELPDGSSLKGLIQTDASINPGNSGGPLLNVLGEVIGVNTAIRGDAQNIGFAIGVDHMRDALPELLDLERRYRIETGMDVATIGAPRITRVDENSPAHNAGIEAGDTLRAVDGKRIEEGVTFYIDLIGRAPGDELNLTLDRDNQSVDATLTIGERPRPDGRALARQRLGVELTPLPDDLAEHLGLPPGTGLLIESIRAETPAARHGLRRGDVLVSIDRHDAATLDRLGQLLEYVEPGQRITVGVLRVTRGRLMRVYIQLPAG